MGRGRSTPPGVRNQAPPAALLFIFYFSFALTRKHQLFCFFCKYFDEIFNLHTGPGLGEAPVPPPGQPPSALPGALSFFPTPKGTIFFF